MTTPAQAVMADLVVELEAQLDGECAAHAKTQALLQRCELARDAALKDAATAEGRLAEALRRAEAAERIAERPIPAAVKVDLSVVTAAIEKSQKVIVQAMPKPVEYRPIEYEGIEAQRDGAGLLRAFKFVRKV